MLFLMEIILPSGLKPCVVISKAVSCGFMSLVTVLFQNKLTKKLIMRVDKETKFSELPNRKKIMSEFENLVNIGNKQGWCRDITKMRDMHRRTICSVYGRERSSSV